MEKKKIYVNTKASRMVKFLRGLYWFLAILGIIVGLIQFGEMEEEIATPVFIAGVVCIFVAIFMKPVYVRTLAAEIEIAKAKEEFDLFADPEFKEKLKV